MNSCYVYSFDRETFTGCFPSREKAIAEAMEKARLEDISPPTVYIGQIVPPDPHAAGNAFEGFDCVVLRLGRKTSRIGTDDVAGLERFLKEKVGLR